MIRFLIAICLMLFSLPDDSAAQTRERIGYGRLFTNDYFADAKDRWRSGSFASSRIWGFGWDGDLPQKPGDIIELRLAAEIITPENLRRPARGDRPFAGVLSAGLHTHFMQGGTDVALGADLVVIGPQTRLDQLQNAFHDQFGLRSTSPQTRADQIDDAVYLSGVAEAGHTLVAARATHIRPFAEARGGVENLLRVGVDVTFGDLVQGELLVRDAVTGQRYRTRPGNQTGFTFLLGADVAGVASSVYLPADKGVVARDTRNRYRGGVHWQGGPVNAFYGLTYMDKEFEGQGEGQFVGSVRIGFRF